MLEQLCDDLARVRARVPSVQDFKLTSIEVTETRFRHSEVEALLTAVARLERSREGWVRRQSIASLCPSNGLDESGHPIEGEWVSSRESSTRLGLHDDGWRLLEIAEDDSMSGSQPVLRQERSLVAERAGENRWLDYAVYWGQKGDTAGEIAPVAFRLLGIR